MIQIGWDDLKYTILMTLLVKVTPLQVRTCCKHLTALHSLVHPSVIKQICIGQLGLLSLNAACIGTLSPWPAFGSVSVCASLQGKAHRMHVEELWKLAVHSRRESTVVPVDCQKASRSHGLSQWDFPWLKHTCSRSPFRTRALKETSPQHVHLPPGWTVSRQTGTTASICRRLKRRGLI